MASHGIARTIRGRTDQQRLQDLEKIKIYRDLESQVRSQAALGNYDLALFNLTTKLLGLNPEYHTIWNVRRRCLLSGLLPSPPDESPSLNAPASQAQSSDAPNLNSDGSVFQSELTFIIPLLLKFPKSYCIWSFRKWVLSQAILRLQAPIAREIWESELGLVSKMITRDSRNFHAWGYRRFVVAKLESHELQGKSMAETEFTYTTNAIERNLSNFSAWHNRSQLIPRLLDERCADDKMRAAFFDKELNNVREALDVGPEDQSLWNYHSFLISHLVDHRGRQTIVPALTLPERTAYLRREVDEIKDLLEDYPNIKWIYMGLLECSLGLERLGYEVDRSSSGFHGSETWLLKVRALDPMRTGRWIDMERDMKRV
ncbi:prenyltransferase alpha subunit repeat protein [Xylaria grammica]|nr:prenyltransferase alpha subunit repeat protein [Xylaria grammica]